MTELLKDDLAYILKNTKDIWPGLKGKKIFLTGGTGFFGKWLLETFSYIIKEMSLDIHVFVLSRNPEAFIVRHPHLGEKTCFTFLRGEISDFPFPESDIDLIIHAATEASAKLNNEQPLVMIDSIIQGTRSVLEFARLNNVKRMLFISSGAVYGIQPDGLKGFSEDYSGSPNSLDSSSAYAEAKRMAELLCACYCKQYQIEIPIARCFAFVGPYLDLDIHFAIGNFIRNGLNNENIIIKGNGKPLRSYMYAADLVIWLLHIFVRGGSNVAYNVGSDDALSIKELAYRIAAFFPGINIEILNQTNPTDRNQNYVPDIQKAQAYFDFNCPIGIDESIRRTINFYKLKQC